MNIKRIKAAHSSKGKQKNYCIGSINIPAHTYIFIRLRKGKKKTHRSALNGTKSMLWPK